MQIDSTFAHPIVQRAEVPSTQGWDKACQIVYRPPLADGKSAVATFRMLDGSAYIGLIYGSKAALSRRMAQITEILQAWKPIGLKAISLAERELTVLGKEQAAHLKQFIAEAMQALYVPGVSICIVQKGRVVLAEGFGIRKLDSPEPVTSRTRFMIGSSTKPLTTLMMARLVDQGVFAWNTPITALLPEFELGDAEITSRMEMRHTVGACTGMPRRDMELVFRSKNISPEERLAQMKTMRPTTGFGETFQYSNLLVAVGGYAAGRCYQPGLSLASGYEKAMQDLIFTPLRMTETFLKRSEALRENFASPHATDLEGRSAVVDLTVELSGESVAPAGGIWSTAEDMAQYLFIELLGGKTLEGMPLLSRETLQSRWRGGIKITDQMSYGLGLVQSYEHGLEIMSHGGNTLGFSSDLYFLPGHDLGVVVLTNLRVANTFLSLIRQRIFELLFGAEAKASQMLAAASKFKQEATDRLRHRIKIDPVSVAWLEEWVGSYRSGELGPARITKEDDQYWIQFEDWGSALGVEIEGNGDRLIALTSPPWSGTFRFQTSPENRTLLINASQDVYRFERSTDG